MAAVCFNILIFAYRHMAWWDNCRQSSWQIGIGVIAFSNG